MCVITACGLLFTSWLLTLNSLKAEEKPDQLPTIISPQAGQEFEVNVDSKLVIDCKAILYSEMDEVYWTKGDSYVDDNTTLTVYSKSTRETDSGTLKMTASLTFMKVSEEHLTNPYYSCILD